MLFLHVFFVMGDKMDNININNNDDDDDSWCRSTSTMLTKRRCIYSRKLLALRLFFCLFYSLRQCCLVLFVRVLVLVLVFVDLAVVMLFVVTAVALVMSCARRF